MYLLQLFTLSFKLHQNTRQTFSVEEAGEGVGEGDEETEHVELQDGGIHCIHLQDSGQQLQTVRPTPIKTLINNFFVKIIGRVM